MRFISCKLEDLKKIVLPIGYEGENEHTRVQVDAGEVFKEYPAAVPSLKVLGPGGTIYPAEVIRDGKSVIWDIKASDCAADGSGEAQFTFTLNNVIVKSCIAKIKVYRSIVGGSTPPDPVQDWLDEAQDVLDDLEDAEVHQPMIGVDGYWYTWDQENEEYTKTETKAQGEDGQQGPAGQDGAPGQDATPALITVNYSDLTFPVAKDTQCYHDGLLYYAKQDIQTSEAWTAAHWQQTTVEEQQRLLKTAIQGKPSDVQINGTSIVNQGVANIPLAGMGTPGALLVDEDARKGLFIDESEKLSISSASAYQVKQGSNSWKPLTPCHQEKAAFYGMAKAAGDNTQYQSNNNVGVYTENAKSKIHDMLDAPETVSGSTPSITAKAGVRYICGEVSTLTIVVPASGIIDVVFTSGSTATVLTITPPSGQTVTWANGFDPTNLDTNTVYELNIMDCLGVAGSWA